MAIRSTAIRNKYLDRGQGAVFLRDLEMIIRDTDVHRMAQSLNGKCIRKDVEDQIMESRTITVASDSKGTFEKKPK